MREIKFRAWDRHSKTMITDAFYLINFNGDLLYNETATGEWLGFENNDDVILMQYTGLLDKNGKEICENDDIEYYYENRNGIWKERKTVQFVNGAFGFNNDLKEFILLSSINDKCKVIGNIHENQTHSLQG